MLEALDREILETLLESLLEKKLISSQIYHTALEKLPSLFSTSKV